MHVLRSDEIYNTILPMWFKVLWRWVRNVLAFLLPLTRFVRHCRRFHHHRKCPDVVMASRIGTSS